MLLFTFFAAKMIYNAKIDAPLQGEKSALVTVTTRGHESAICGPVVSIFRFSIRPKERA